jgi:hypothetical protein
MNIILVSHPSRAHYVHLLQQNLPVMTTVINTVSAKDGHRQALMHAERTKGRVIIMEDDAIPVRDFESLAKFWCDAHPDALLSFYLGTSRPFQFQALIAERMRIADLQNRGEITLPTLIHAVCYSIPEGQVSRVLDSLDGVTQTKEADFAIGAAWGRSVVYPVESLVQHRDGSPVERHPDGMVRSEPRVARRLAGSLMFIS